MGKLIEKIAKGIASGNIILVFENDGKAEAYIGDNISSNKFKQLLNDLKIKQANKEVIN